jgi:tocopherol O-methyltransferase
MNTPPGPTAEIREYYEQNTRLFEQFGSSSKTHSIHRALWPQGTVSLEQALDQSNQLVLQALQPQQTRAGAAPFVFADLGCGIAGTLIFLLRHLPEAAGGLGLTISPFQARLARAHLAQVSLASRGLILEGDFLALPLRPGLDALLSIEAFVHAPDPARYFSEAARVLRPGGRLVLVDDFLPADGLPEQSEQRRWLRVYRSGWRVPGLSSLAQVNAWARDCGLGLVSDQNLTPWLRLRTLPRWLTRFILALGSKIPIRHAILPSMLGSLALQHCLKAGLVEYHLLVFEKQGVCLRNE